MAEEQTEQTTSDQVVESEVQLNDNNTNKNTENVDDSNAFLETTESKQEMANALTSLISTFRDEAQQQDELLSALQNDATNNPDFGNKKRALQWNINEVCYWLTTIGLQDYINPFYASSIDGTILLNDITEDLLKNDLNVKPLHSRKILREIENLKKQDTPEPIQPNESDTNLNEMIATIKKENEELLSQLNKQKALNAELKTNTNQDFHSIPNGSTDQNGKNGTSHTDIIGKQNKIIQDLTDQLKQLQSDSNKKIKELQKKNKKLQDGYIQIETHYQSQLEHSRTKSKNLQAQISSMNDGGFGGFGDDGQIGLLWAENDNTTKELQNEKEKRIMLEASFKNVQLSLNRERQKRKLLESQTSRLTSELTKYLTPNEMDQSNGTTQRFARFKLNKNKKNNNNNNNDDNDDNKSPEESPKNMDTDNSTSRRKPSMDAKAGWLKFLSSAAAVGNNLKNKNKDKDNKDKDERSGSFQFAKQSLTNIGQKLRRKSSDNTDNTDENKPNSPNSPNSPDSTNELHSVDEEKEDDDNDDMMEENDDKKHNRKATLGQTVMATFKKIQNAAQAKMEERANKKQQKKNAMDTEHDTEHDTEQDTEQDKVNNDDVYRIQDMMKDVNISEDKMDKNDDNNNDDKKVQDTADGDDVYRIEDIMKDMNISSDNTGPKVNANVDDDEHVVDEDSSAEKAELEYKHKIIITGPNHMNNNDNDNDNIDYDSDESDDSIIIKGDDDNHVTTGMEIEFAPSLEPLPQDPELDTDASY